jgi:hypothetical protein
MSMPTTGTAMVTLLENVARHHPPGISYWPLPRTCLTLGGTMLQGSTRSPQLTPEPEVLGDCARVPRSAPKESDKRQGLTR